MKSNLNKPSHVHSYDTKYNNIILTPDYRCTSSRNAPLYTGIRIFNHLPTYLIQTTNLLRFKRKLKTLIQKFSFYNLNEYFSENFSESHLN